LRWIEFSKYIKYGFMSKDKEALNTYEIIYSQGFKKIMSYYPIHITPEKHTQTDKS
jgi:hypothetical protein